nr:MAG TPA: hypothetical protein [Caudoviricetes sp.]
MGLFANISSYDIQAVIRLSGLWEKHIKNESITIIKI